MPTWKPTKGTMSGKDYGKAVSSAAKAMGAAKKAEGVARKPARDAVAGRVKVTPKMPTVRKMKK